MDNINKENAETISKNKIDVTSSYNYDDVEMELGDDDLEYREVEDIHSYIGYCPVDSP